MREPVHVVYGGAHLFGRAVAHKLGELALRALDEHGPITQVLGFPEEIEARVREKLARDPVEAYCIDFEDGYGSRGDIDEDNDAQAVAEEIAAGLEERSLPPFLGIRIKPLNSEWEERGLHTLDIVFGVLGGAADLPEHFSVTLPKVTGHAEVTALLQHLEAYGEIPIELMIETPEAVLRLPEILEAASGRCGVLHFGAYDFTAGLGLSASDQRLDHPFCDFARATMSLHAASHGIRLCDGAAGLLPVGDRDAVHRGWKEQAASVRRSLSNGFYQSWDLHPAQLPARYAAVYHFYRQNLLDAGERLRRFAHSGERAIETRGVFDDAATRRGLETFFRRALDCGAISEQEAIEIGGVRPEELRSFA